MSQTEDVTMEPVRWPIAPDGYIPNSVIRNWSRGGRSLSTMDSWDDIIFDQDGTSDDDDDDDDDDDMSGRVFWFNNFDDDEDEEEITFSVKRRRKEEDDGKDRGNEDKRDEMGRDNKKETELEEEKKDETERRDPLKRSTDLQRTTHLNHEDRKMRREAGSTYSSRTVENFLQISSHGNRPEPLREPREDVKFPEVVTSPPQHRSEPQRTSSFIPKGCPEPQVERPATTTDHLVPKQSFCRQQDSLQELRRPQARDTRIKTTAKPRFTTGPPTAGPQDWTPHHQESAPSIPEDPQPQPDLVPPDSSPTEDKRFLLYSAKYKNIVDCDYVPLDPKVLRVYKDMNVSRCGKLSRPPDAPKVIRYTGGVSLIDGLRSASVRTKSSTVQARPHRVCHSKCRRRPLRPDPTQFVQTFTYSDDQIGLEPEPERTSLQGFCPARQATTKPLVKPSNMDPLAASMTPVQLGQVPAPQMMVQRTEMKDTQVLDSSHFHYLIFLASQHSIFTLDPCRETHYGNLQVDWMALTCCS